MITSRRRVRALAITGAATLVAAALAAAGDATVASGPTNTTLPSVSGTAQQGATLTTTSGSWSGSGTITFQYRWERCDNSGSNCANISGATSQTYVATNSDVGSTLRSQVTATDSTGTNSAQSTQTAVVTGATPPTETAAPSISGSAVVGRTLTAAKGTWSGAAPITYAYQWRRCDTGGSSCSDENGATSSTYVVVAADQGSTIRVVVTASNPGGQAQATSAQTSSVNGGSPLNSEAPAISGNTGQGQTLSVSNGTWLGNTPITYAYQWQRCDGSGNNCAAISGATKQTYQLTSADVNDKIRAAVIATNSVGNTTATSNTVGPIGATTPVNTVAPVVGGTATQGQTLTVSNGTWTSSTTLTYTYAWQRCDSSGNNCAAISGATKQTYVLASADVGQKIRAVVSAANSSGTTAAASNVLGPIIASGPAGAVKLPNGLTSVPASSITDADRLTIAKVTFAPKTVVGRAPVKMTIRVTDEHHDVVNGALVYVVALPYNWALKTAELRTGVDGTVTITVTPTRATPRRGALVLFVRARTPQGNALAGSSTRRLVQVLLRG